MDYHLGACSSTFSKGCTSTSRFSSGDSASSRTRPEISVVKNLSMEPLVERLVEANSKETKRIRKMIFRTFPTVQIRKVDRVENSFLKAMYLLKKDEYLSRYETVEEKELFHVTGVDNVKSITNNNFDWRRVSRGLFGKGTSFSGDAEYANCHANHNIGSFRAIIITKVLVSKQIGGRKNLKIPQNNYDTTIGNGKVYVKFCDNETLPTYVAYYKIGGFTAKYKNTHAVFDYNVDDDYYNGFDYDDYYY